MQDSRQHKNQGRFRKNQAINKSKFINNTYENIVLEKKSKLKIGVVTFDPMPKMFFNKKLKNFQIYLSSNLKSVFFHHAT